MTGRVRLPDFVLAGEMKCGTTSVAHHLDAHPAAHVSTTRPVRFFDERWERGVGWYAAQFAAAPEGAVLGDDTPNYLFDPVAVERLATTLPEARVIVLLREPIRRAWSHYWHHERTGFDRRSFEEAVTRELDHGVGDPGTPEGSGYVGRGCYDVTLRRLFSFVDRERVHVAFFDDLETDPAGLVRRLYEFIGVDPGFRPEGLGTVYNVGWTPRSHRLNALGFRLSTVAERLARPLLRSNARSVTEVRIDDAVHRRLEDHFAPHAIALADLLGRTDVPPWLVR